jgi:hypothetical protein
MNIRVTGRADSVGTSVRNLHREINYDAAWFARDVSDADARPK